MERSLHLFNLRRSCENCENYWVVFNRFRHSCENCENSWEKRAYLQEPGRKKKNQIFLCTKNCHPSNILNFRLLWRPPCPFPPFTMLRRYRGRSDRISKKTEMPRMEIKKKSSEQTVHPQKYLTSDCFDAPLSPIYNVEKVWCDQGGSKK